MTNKPNESVVMGRDQNEAQLHAVLNTVPDAILTIDEDGIINSFSPGAEKVFGYASAKVIGRNVKMLMPAPYREEHDGYMGRYKTTGEKRIIGIGRQIEAQREDGSVFPMNLAVNEMVVEGQRMFIGVVHDISQLTEAQSISNRLERILDRLINEIYVFDAGTLRFSQINRGAQNNLGYTAEELQELTPVDIKPEMTSIQFDDVLAPLRDGSKELQVFKTLHQRKDGSVYPVEVHLQLMANETPPVFTAIIQDITESERKEAMLRHAQKMEAVGQLTGGIAHDFNNLLTVILGNSELLMMRLEDGDPARKLLEDAVEAAEHAAELTGQLLAFARQQPLRPKALDLNELVLRMIDLLRRTLGETIRLNTVLSTDLGKALADPAQVHNALLNLAINARDAMPDGGELIIETSNVVLSAEDASVLTDAAAGDFVTLTVRDTGAGMPPDVIAKVFDPFFTTKETGKGTGLGLSMVHGFAKQSGGHVDLHSEVGHGTSVCLYLPDAGEEAAATLQAEASRTSGDKTGERVLAVEDDERVRKITISRLEHLGYRVVARENARAALDYLEESACDVDLLFTDVVMPGGMTGVKLAQTVREKYPEIKVILTSGYAEEGIPDSDEFPWLRKPFSLPELARTLRTILD